MANEQVGWTVLAADTTGVLVKYSFAGKSVAKLVRVNNPTSGDATMNAIKNQAPIDELKHTPPDTAVLIGRSGTFPAPQGLIDSLPPPPPPLPPDPETPPPTDV